VIDGLQIIVSEYALEETDVRLFPASRNRSRRIHKKLVKRFGGEFKKQPCIYRMGDKWIAHPVLYDRLKREIAHRQSGQVNMVYAGNPL
jgi:hypothetical protein